MGFARSPLPPHQVHFVDVDGLGVAIEREDDAETDRRFDVIIVDSTDPQGPGAVLFTHAFYAVCKRCMAKGGVMVTQNGVPIFQPGELKAGVKKFRCFPHGEYRLPAHSVKRLGVSLPLRVADEQNLTRGQFLRFAYAANFNAPIVDHRTTGNFRQRSSKRKLPENANQK